MSAIEQTDLALILPLSGVQAIEASAGTGKTYALAGIHARLIVEKKLQVREILVVTYTRAAADELRGRLRERLTLCAQIAEGAEPAPDIAEKSEAKFCRQLIANAHAAGEARNALVRRLRLAALSLDQAQISTVHAFCERALRELAWSGGVPPLDGKLVDALVLIDTIAADLWRERATATDTLAWNALLAVAKSPSGFASLLRELRDTDSVLEPETILSADVLRERIVQAQTVWPDLRKIWRVQGAEAFVALTQQVAADHISKTSYPLEKVAKDAQEFARAFSADMRPDRKLLSRYTTAAIEKARRKKGQSLPTQRFFAAVAAAETTLEQAEIALHQLGLLVLHDCALEMRWRQQRQQREARGYTYDDLISRLHETLCGVHGATTAQILAQRFPVALVDECQDSDARQFDIFLAIYAQRGLLCLIGDPKQSIYRFRGGDVHAYLRALDRADAKHALDRNFRSTPALIAAVNRLYRDAGDAAFGDAQIEFKPVHAGGKACDDDLLIESVAPTPLRIWQIANACSNKAQAMQLLAAGCAEEIVRLLALARDGKALLRREQQDGTRKHEPLRAEDLAVLVARHTEATAMQRALAARGVSSVVVSRASVFASDEASELLGLLRALDSFDPERLRGALSTRLLGKTLADMAALASDVQAWHDQATRFAAWRERWYEHGVLALIELVAEDAAARLLAHADGERRLTNLLHLAELLQQAEAERDGTRALLDWLQQRIARADKDREEEQLRLESDAGRVHIVTVHQSKGLEYPLVFLPFSALRRDERRGEVEVCARFEGVRRVVHLCNTDGADDAPARTRERSEARSEDLRLLYVALTRARVACYFAWGEIGKGSEPPALAALLSAGADSISSGSVSARLAELAASAPNLIACLPLPEPTSQRLAPQDAAALADARQAHRRVHEWRRSHSFSGLSAGAREAQRSGPDIAGAEDERNIGATAIDTPAVPTVLRGTRFGTTFHELLEKVDFSTWRGWQESSPPPTQRDLVDRILHRYAFDSGDDKSAARAVFVQLIVATLNAPLPLGARLADLAPTEHRAEMPFHFAMRSGDAQPWLARMQADGYVQARRHFALEGNRLAGLMTGVLDLVVFHDARWWVIDYKTNLLGTNAAEDYAPARLAIAVREGEYDLQYLIYLTALHRWLKTRLGAAYDYERDIGGALYLFVRGLDSGGVDGVHLDKPPSALIEALDEMLKAPVEIAA